MIVMGDRLVAAVGAVQVTFQWRHQQALLFFQVAVLQRVAYQLRLPVELTEQLHHSMSRCGGRSPYCAER